MLKRIVLGVIVLSMSLFAQQIKVFSASSTKLAMQEIVEKFQSTNPKDEIVVTYNATGKAYAQLSNGFEYDIFIAADSQYPAQIAKDGNAITQPKLYAMGTVALYSTDATLIKLGIDALKSDKIKHISIANPRLAPYGVAALEILKNYGLEELTSKKLVLGDNIAQSVQFVDSGAADIGLVAFSLIKTTTKESQYKVLDQSKYSPMEQSFVITKYAKDKEIAFKFASFLTSKESQEIFQKYGFGSIDKL